MDNSLKIGAISGLIAGFVFLVVGEIAIRIGLSMGLWDPWFRPFLMNNTLVNIPLLVSWGVVLGIIYSKVYSLIPRSGILKGLVYGLFLYLIVSIRIETFTIPYGLVLSAAGHIFAAFFEWTAYGLSLGLLYKFLRDRYYPTGEEPKIVTYDMRSGLQPGAIAGVLGGIAAGVLAVMGHATGYWGVFTAGKLIPTIQFWYSQFGHHVFTNMIWGTVFGMFFPKVYNLIPGKNVTKGFYYGLIVFLVTTFQVTTWTTCWYAYHSAWQLFLFDVLGLTIGASNAIVFGLVLGALYKKPSE